MNIEVLVSTMHQNDLSLIKKMNLQTNAIIINQCNRNSYLEKSINNRQYKMYSFSERGVGKSRNNALMRSTADICVMADDDVVYLDNYEAIIKDAFIRMPNADVIMFNVPSYNKERDTITIEKTQRVRYHNCLKYGTFNMAFKRESILKANIFFSLLFGGGAVYSAGEDSLFIMDCLKKGLIIYADTHKIADVYHETSTWFTGFNDKYFLDKGAFFAAVSSPWCLLLILQFAIRRHKLYKKDMSFAGACAAMLEGKRNFNDTRNDKKGCLCNGS
ncbi:MAG: glycosyltransferase family 2 protein [Pelosinus sp.]|nr:glycosyltransferase family 2 protein [Pelosinus sp.]